MVLSGLLGCGGRAGKGAVEETAEKLWDRHLSSRCQGCLKQQYEVNWWAKTDRHAGEEEVVFFWVYPERKKLSVASGDRPARAVQASWRDLRLRRKIRRRYIGLKGAGPILKSRNLAGRGQKGRDQRRRKETSARRVVAERRIWNE